MPVTDELQSDERARKQEIRARNLRTGLILASIALVFFVGIFLKFSLLKH